MSTRLHSKVETLELLRISPPDCAGNGVHSRVPECRARFAFDMASLFKYVQLAGNGD